MAHPTTSSLPAWRMACIAMPLRHVYSDLPDDNSNESRLADLLVRLRGATQG